MEGTRKVYPFNEINLLMSYLTILLICFRAMPKFIKRLKAPDYKDKNVFGVPLLVILQRTGQALPQCILYAMRCLRRTAKDAVGIFRKSGVRSRIQKLRNEVEENPGTFRGNLGVKYSCKFFRALATLTFHSCHVISSHFNFWCSIG